MMFNHLHKATGRQNTTWSLSYVTSANPILLPNWHLDRVVLTTNFPRRNEELISELRDSEGEAVNPGSLFGRHIHNVICQLLMMSYRFQANDKNFTMFNESLISEEMIALCESRYSRLYACLVS
ncbi:hypothetical protein PYW08_012619 [Mythimna loreyi]|uniref:Uncharacterized protein n=1 Tax=Mythimna loreyi TaxID=667449 RepID=A0ACC2Q0N5_9NEOP|nr:hypothetical protein PYW08_012619 [Mythimna loreyi]